MVLSLAHKKIIHKRTKKFLRFWSDRLVRIGPQWQHEHGIDCVQRRQFRGNRPLVSIGYGSDKQTKYMLQNGFYPYLVHNVNDLEAIKTQNKVYAAVIAHQTSEKKRKQIIEKAKEYNIKVQNAGEQNQESN